MGASEWNSGEQPSPRVAVVGRRGVGRSTVAAALRLRGVPVVATEPDARLLVVAESWKPEDAALLAADPVPTVVVLTKADVTGSSAGGPMAGAKRYAAELAVRAGVPVVPAVGLLAAVTVLEDELIAALRALVTAPAEFGSVDAFIAADHPVERDVRRRLLERLDRFGIAHAVMALHDGADPDALVARLHAVSNVDAVLAALHAVTAPVRYRRMQRALSELRCLAATLDDGSDRVHDWLGSADVALAVMAAAVDVVEAAGHTVDRADDPAAHERRALLWHRYASGPLDALHRACAADVVRGSLVLLNESRVGR